jgi:hypothetical protein
METAAIISRYLNFILALLVVIFMTKIVYRTEKQLDKVFKLLLSAGAVVLVASFLNMDYHFGIIPADWARIILLGSRTLELFLFLLAGFVMLKLINDESCK